MDANEHKIPYSTTVQCRRPFTIKNFLRCFCVAVELIFVLLFIEMIIAGAFLRISPKILGALLLLIAIVTVVPRRIHKYIALVFLVFLTSTTIWVLRPDADKLWQVATYDAEFADLESDFYVAPEENAAEIYSSLMEEYDGSIFRPNIKDFVSVGLDFTSVFSTEGYPDLAGLISVRQDTVKSLLAAAEFEKCHFPFPANLEALQKSQYRQAVMKCWARLLLNSANNDLGDGRIDLALGKQFAVLQMADHLYQQRTLFDNSAAIYIELMAFENINSFVMNHCQSLSCLEQIISRLEFDDKYFPENWPVIYDSYKLLVKNTVGVLYETHPDGRTRRSHSIAPRVNRYFSAKMRISPFQMSIVKAGVIGHWFILPATPVAVSEVIDDSFARFSPTEHPEKIQNGEPKTQLNFKHVCDRTAYNCAKFYFAVQTKSRRRANAARSTAILVELRRYYLKHGEYPTSLAELESLAELALIDTVNDSPFTYKLTDDSFILYSTGRNKTDDGGVSAPVMNFDDIRYYPADPPREAFFPDVPIL